MPQKIKFTKQYKPIKFGDGPDPDTVEGHRNKVIEAAEKRAYDRRMKELAAEDAARREGLLSKVFGHLFEVTKVLTALTHTSACYDSFTP